MLLISLSNLRASSCVKQLKQGLYSCFDIRDLAIHGEVDELFLEWWENSEILADLFELDRLLYASQRNQEVRNGRKKERKRERKEEKKKERESRDKWEKEESLEGKQEWRKK